MFKKGDKVLVIAAQNGIRAMQQMIGSVCTIDSFNSGVYELKEDKYRFSWIDDWLKPYEPVAHIEIQEDNILELLGEEYAKV